MNLGKWKIFEGVDPRVTANVRLAYVANFSGGIHPVGVLVTHAEDVYSIRDHQRLNWLGVEADQVRTNEVVKIESLCGKRIIDCKNTVEGIMVLTNEGRVYHWGNNQTPQLVSGGGLEIQHVVQLASGHNHCLALTSDGHVYAWGENRSGQLGVGNAGVISGAMEVSFSSNVDIIFEIKSVACGAYTSYAVDINGRVWWWGRPSNNSLNYHTNGNQRTPEIIPQLGRVKKIVAGMTHVVALTNQNELYYWGQFTTGDSSIQVPTKMVLPHVKVDDIAATWNQRFGVLKCSAQIYLWGYWHNQMFSRPFCTGFSSIDKVFLAAQLPSMIRPMEVKQPKSRDSAEAWKRLVQDSPSCSGDLVKFKVDQEVIPAYKGFLKRRNEYFRSMFQNEWKECNNSEGFIEIQGFSAEGFKKLIFYLYTDELMNPEMPLDEMSELLHVADFYQESSLKEICTGILKSKITLENACAMYAISVRCNANSLQSAIIDLTVREYASVVRSNGFAEMPNDLKTQLVREVLEHPGFRISCGVRV